jgi:hypothetical protein
MRFRTVLTALFLSCASTALAGDSGYYLAVYHRAGNNPDTCRRFDVGSRQSQRATCLADCRDLSAAGYICDCIGYNAGERIPGYCHRMD